MSIASWLIDPIEMICAPVKAIYFIDQRLL